MFFDAGMQIRFHDFEFFIEAGFVDFLFFELFLERCYIGERSETVMINIALTSFFKIEIAVLPKGLFCFSLF